MTLAARFLKAFEGSQEGHGKTTVTDNKRSRDGKAEAKSFVIRGPLSEEDAQKHLDGIQGIGNIPINRDNMCKFGAIDIDEYSLDHQELVRRVKQFRLPLIICRSKSGGGHLFLFLNDWVQASLLREYLTEAAAAIGFAQSEIFPKQDTILLDRGDVGNFINLPYFDYENSLRYAYKADGEAMSLEEFLDAVEMIRQNTDLSSMEGIDYVEEGQEPIGRDTLSEMVPCVRNRLRTGPIDSDRNTSLFNAAINFKKQDGDNWKHLLEEFNYRHCSPPLPAPEMSILQKQHEKKDYGFQCGVQPNLSFCDKAACRKLKCGIGGKVAEETKLSGLTIMLSDPKLLFLDVNGKRLELGMKELQHQTLFAQACMEQLFFAPQKIKEPDWIISINNLMNNATQVPVPEELTTKGQFLDLLKLYCTSRVRALDPEELTMGKPWVDEKTGKTKFMINGLVEFLKQRNFTLLSKPQLQQILESLNPDGQCAGHQNVKKPDGSNSTIRVWWIPSYENNEVAMPHKEIQNDVPF